MEYKFNRIDVDAHYQEKPDTWTSRMSAERWGDRIPHLEENPDGSQYWIIDGTRRIDRLASCVAVLPDRETVPPRWEQIPKIVYDPIARLGAMDQDEVDVQVLYPNITGGTGETFFGTEPEFEADAVRAYNDYMSEEVLGASDRYVPLTVIPYSDIERTVSEVRYATDHGHRGVIMLSAPHQRGKPHFNDSYWNPLWATCQELEIPVNFHGSGGAPKMRIEILKGTSFRRSRALTGTIGFNLQAQFYANFLLSGILDRFPKLTFVCAESGIGWVPYLLEMCDYEWEKCDLAHHGLPRKPSEIFKAQCYIDFWYEKLGLAYRHTIGVDRLLWETDYPHPTSIWPDSTKWLDWSLEGVPDDERHQILFENPRKAYGLS